MSPIGIARVNHSGQVIYGNPKWMEMCGHPGVADDAQFPGQNLSELVHPNDRQKLEELWGAESEKVAFELRWGGLDQFVWVMGELVPEIVADEHRGFIAVLTDITERRRFESAKLQAAEDARAREGLAIGNTLVFSIDGRHHLPRITKSVKRHSQ
jgi:PAS domain S-box-containing protein